MLAINLMRLARFALAGAFLLIGLMGSHAIAQGAESCDQPKVISEVRRIITRDNKVVSDEKVALPDKLPSIARLSTSRIEYFVDVSACAARNEMALYSFRIGAPYRIYAPDMLEPWLPAAGFRESLIQLHSTYSNNGRSPVIFALPNETTKVKIVFQAPPYLTFGLTTVMSGTQASLATQQTRDNNFVAAASDFVAWLTLLIGAFSLYVCIKRPTDLGLRWFSFACLAWGTRSLLLLANLMPGTGFFFELLISFFALISGLALVVAVFYATHTTTLLMVKRFGQVFAGFVALHVLALYFVDSATPLRMIGGLVLAAILVWSVYRVLRTEVDPKETSDRTNRLMAFAMLALLFCGLNDYCIGVGIFPPTRHVLMYWGFTSVLLALAILIGSRGIASLNRAQNTNIELEERVAQKNAELKTFYDASQEKQLNSERARLNREIHDGIGAQLMTALRGVERGALSQNQITDSLQEGLDELRLLMDSADIGQDLHGALFSWRNRWEPRLNAVDLLLHWQVSEDIANIKLSQQVILQLIRILQESVANVVKHAKATSVDVNVIIQSQTLVLVITDDGIGISDTAFGASHRGLKHMEQRATQIGASYSIQKLNSPEHGTRVELKLILIRSD